MKDRPTIQSSADAHRILAPLIADLDHKEFWILLLNRANKVIGKEMISAGGITGTVVDSRIIFNKAIQQLCCAIILCHNHPSGNLKPSQADINITQKLIKAGKVLDISVLDHLIISERGYYSFADEGAM